MNKMKTNILSLTLLSFSLFLFSCNVFDEHVKPSSNVTTRNESFEDYDMIEASNAFEVYVNFSDTEEIIEIEANDNLHQYIEVRKINNTLEIGLKNNVSIRGNATLRAYITTKHVSAYSGSGASRFVLESDLDSENVSVQLSGASNFNGDITTNQFLADLSGASVMNISGTSKLMDIEISGASVSKDFGFSTDNLIAEISGASDMYITVNNEIDIDASGASILKYKGDAVIKHQDISGASNVIKVN